MIGAAAANQANAECHAYAVRRALELAMEEDARRQQAAQAAYEEAQREAEEAEARGQRLAAQRHRQEMAAAKARESQHNYSSIAYRSSDGQTGVITPLSNETDPATKRVCMTINDSTNPGQSRYCRDASGNWQPVAAK